MKKNYFFAGWAKVLVIAGWLFFAAMLGFGVSWLSYGCRTLDMTLREAVDPGWYPGSQAAVGYLYRESCIQLTELMGSDAFLADQAEDTYYIGDIAAAAQAAAAENAATQEENSSPDELYRNEYGTFTESSNALVYLKNKATGEVYTNVADWQGLELPGVLDSYINNGYSAVGDGKQLYCAYEPEGSWQGNTTESYVSATKNQTSLLEVCKALQSGAGLSDENCAIFVGLNTNYPVRTSDSYYLSQGYVGYAEATASLPMTVPSMLLTGGIGMGICLILLTWQTGRNAVDKKRQLCRIDRAPIELLMLADFLLWIIVLVFAVNALDYLDDPSVVTISGTAFCVAAAVCAAVLLAWDIKHYVRRIKAGTLGGSAAVSLLRLSRNHWRVVWESRKDKEKLIIRYCLIMLLQAIGCIAMGLAMSMMPYGGGLAFLILLILLLLFDLHVLSGLLKSSRSRDILKEGITQLADGNLDYQIDTSQLTGDSVVMAEKLNSLQEGLRRAVETQMKSERLKTDLITNVSHDIKTPLTSIINYVDILKREELQDEKIAGYIEVLDRKSQRLKQLTDDLVEASKISSGVITLDMTEINLKQLIKQTNGEFGEKFEARQLELVCELPEGEMLILADGRRMFRVIENLYNNAAKYSMPGSRVYVSGGCTDGQVSFSIKNMSENKLNFKAEELMERFVRGDVSRSTEGSGLGLEIARNLTVMQKGDFNLYLDGDLFKVTLTFAELRK